MTKFFLTFRMALRDARANLMHTLLSVLGIVIGVTSLVAILSLIDGMEKYAHEQIGKTTTLESVMINTKLNESVDNMSIKKDTYAYFDYTTFTQMLDDGHYDAKAYMYYQESGWLNADDSLTRKGVRFSGVLETLYEGTEILAGRYLNKDDLDSKDSVILISKEVAQHLADSTNYEKLLSTNISFKEGVFRIVGVIDIGRKRPELFVPITIISPEKIKNNPPFCMVRANSISDVTKIKESIESWVAENFKQGEKDIRINTNEGRLKQANEGFLIFRIVMGLIVGISVLVGGVGVMNVLLISVTERTAEIGVRKAVGAKRKDIVTQFLSESIAISGIGSLLGLLFGIGFTMIAVPIVKSVTEMPFEAAYTLNTLFIIGVISIIIGIVFGTYPAIKASKLDPVEAIRRE